jgi:acid stress-induced BolA-like protein IbaG/YrbA
MLTSDQLKTYIMNGLPCQHVEVRGDDGTHFEAVVVSAEFVGKNMVQQHQMVYKALGDRMREEIHALSLKTLAPSQWNK